MFYKTNRLIISVSIAFMMLSCNPSITKMVLQELNDGKYDSEFPYKNASDELEEISTSIKMIHGMAFYKSYSFKRNLKLKKNEQRFKQLKKYAEYEITFHETYSGTATVIYKAGRKAAFLTCAHVLDFPDTLIFYYYDSIGQKTEYISGVAIKTNQKNYLPEVNGQNKLEILAFDRRTDLAVLGGNFKILKTLSLKKFSYPLGNSQKLNWGNFVYLFGYPLNTKMITKGIVSLPKTKGSNIFYVDANINRGFSGGLVLAIKDGIPNFELVGIVKSGTGKTDYYLKPENGKKYPPLNSRIPYKEKIYVDKNLNIRYGITNVISIETVLNFLRMNKSVFEIKGYDFRKFFN